MVDEPAAMAVVMSGARLNRSKVGSEQRTILVARSGDKAFEAGALRSTLHRPTLPTLFSLCLGYTARVFLQGGAGNEGM
ncbi:hypothetical protein XI03_02205 [Bradyrhizobium sp. CCBAU 65884]|nr:hypothetical protein [Bradyrhizobium sp. CCBAU 65884]